MMNGRKEISGGGRIAFLMGCLVGGVAGVLYAPQSGARTRRRLVNFADDVRERTAEVTDDATALVQNAIKWGRRVVHV